MHIMVTPIIAVTFKALALFSVIAKGLVLTVKRLLTPSWPKSLRNEVILVTGGSNGIGRSILERLALLETDLTLISWDIDSASNEATVKQLQALGVKRAVGMKVDVKNQSQVSAAAAKVRQDFGNVTMLFNNAGMTGPFGKCWETDLNGQVTTIQVNFMSHFYTLREFLPWMVENNRGHVIATCSIFGITYLNNFAPYIASKHAILGYYRGLKEDLRVATSNVHLSLVYPGIINTNMTAPFDFNLKAPSLSTRNEGTSASSAGRQIVDGVLRNKANIYVPWSVGLVHALSGTFASEFYSSVLDFFGASRIHHDTCIDKLVDAE